MTKALQEALGVIEGRIAELQQDNELTRLLSARAALRGEDPTQAPDTSELESQRNALRSALSAVEAKNTKAEALVRDLREEVKAQKEVIETQRQAISNLRKSISETTGKETPVPAPKPKEPKAEPSEPRERRSGQNPEAPLEDDVWSVLNDKLGSGWVSFARANEVIKAAYPDANDVKVKRRMGALRDSGRLEHNGRKARASKWRVVKADSSDDQEAAPGATAAPAPPAPAVLRGDVHRPRGGGSPVAVADVHRFVRDQREPFSPARVAEVTGLPREVVLAIIEDLVDRGIAKDISPSADMRLFEYSKPTEAGAAAELDAARRPTTNGGGEASEPVAGTGRGPKVRNKELQALIDACIRAGAKVMATGSGHFAVLHNNTRTLISSTPSNPRSVLNDRTRLRRAGVPV